MHSPSTFIFVRQRNKRQSNNWMDYTNLNTYGLNENLITKIEVCNFYCFLLMVVTLDLLLSYKGLSGAKDLKELNLASNQIKIYWCVFSL